MLHPGLLAVRALLAAARLRTPRSVLSSWQQPAQPVTPLLVPGTPASTMSARSSPPAGAARTSTTATHNAGRAHAPSCLHAQRQEEAACADVWPSAAPLLLPPDGARACPLTRLTAVTDPHRGPVPCRCCACTLTRSLYATVPHFKATHLSHAQTCALRLSLVLRCLRSLLSLRARATETAPAAAGKQPHTPAKQLPHAPPALRNLTNAV